MEGVAVLQSKTVVPVPERGEMVIRLADHSTRVVVPDQKNFKFGIRGDKTVLRRCAEKRGLRARFIRARSGPGPDSANCVVIFSPATKALKYARDKAARAEELFRLSVEAIKDFAARRPLPVPSPRRRKEPGKKAQPLPLTQLRLAALTARK